MMRPDKDLIANDYKFAKDKNKQIKILAELNGCKESEIIDILREKDLIPGLKAEQKPKQKRAKPVIWTEDLDREVQKLSREGLTIVEIAERLGINKQSIYDRRSYFNRLAREMTSKDEEKKKDKPVAIHKKSEEKKAGEKMTKTNALEKAIELLTNAGFEVKECYFNILEKSFYISGEDKMEEKSYG